MLIIICEQHGEIGSSHVGKQGECKVCGKRVHGIISR